MIAGQPRDSRRTDKVQAAVTNVGEVKLPSHDGKSRACSSHTVKLRMFHGVAVNILVSGVEGLEESGLRVVPKATLVDVTHGLDRETAGFLATLVSAHAVGDDSEAAFAEEVLVGVGLPIKIGIFIIGALAADVGQARHLDSGFCVAAVNRHKVSRQPDSGLLLESEARDGKRSGLEHYIRSADAFRSSHAMPGQNCVAYHF